MLPTRKGDAYILKGGRGAYLIDGGTMAGFLPEMLKERLVRKLRAVVCTFPSSRRLGGILDLMESGHSVTEYWLPDCLESLPELARRFDGDWNAWLDLWGWPPFDQGKGINTYKNIRNERKRRLDGAGMLLCLAMGAAFGCVPKVSPESLSADESVSWVVAELTDRLAEKWVKGHTGAKRVLQNMQTRIASAGQTSDVVLLCGRMLSAEAESWSRTEGGARRTVVQNLTMAAMAASLTAVSDARIHFFQQTGRYEDTLVPRHPFRCLNGIETLPVEDLPWKVGADVMAWSAQGMTERNEGLVFQYGTAECGVLLGGHAHLGFLGRSKRLTLDRPAVIAAPRQGGVTGEGAYDRIVSGQPDQDVWVRSHYSYGRKVSTSFKEREIKLCLNSCVHRTVQEVLLSFENGRWECLSGGRCVCDMS